MNNELREIIISIVISHEPRVSLCNLAMNGDQYQSCYEVDCNHCPLAGGTYYNYSLVNLKKGYHE